MTPDQLAKSGSEHGEQVALFAWSNVARLHGFAIAWEWAKEGGRLSDYGAASWKEDSAPAVPALEWLHAIPNGGTRGDDAKSRAIRGGALKAEGVRQGVADIFLPVPKIVDRDKFEGGHMKWAGLYVEMKKPALKPKKEGTKGGLSDEQIAFAEYAKNAGYGWIVCYTWREAATAIQQYIEWGSNV